MNNDLDAFGGAPAGDAEISFPDLDDVKIKTFYLPPGWYNAVCTDVEEKTSQASGNHMFVFEFEIGDSASGTIKKKQHCTLTPGGLPFLKKTLIALCLSELKNVKVSKMVGRRVEIKVVDDPYDGGIGSKIADMRKHPQGAVAIGGSTTPDDDICF